MSIEISDSQRQLIDKIAKKNNFDKYEVTTQAGSTKGDNFMGVLTTVTLNEAGKTLELIMKAALENEALRKITPIHEIYLREIYFYQNVLDSMRRFEEQYNIERPFAGCPKLYGASKADRSECFVLENLRSLGYTLWDKKSPMNSGHITAVLKQYAKFHAISMAMKYTKPDLFEAVVSKVSKYVFDSPDMQKDVFETIATTQMSGAYKAVEGEPEMTEILNFVKEKLVEEVVTRDSSKDEYRLTLIHGDCWCNNFMFKYDNEANTEAPNNVKIIDWQLSHVSSPAYDFCYFFLANSPKDILDDYKSYMKIYYEALAGHLREFNCDPDDIFSFARFERHVEKFMIHGFFISFIVMKVMLWDPSEVPDMSKLKEEDFMKSFQADNTLNNDTFKERIKNLIVFGKKLYNK
ncbi:unnamed protein product [Phyllotreta striolata]|uniref:CHK kinase-like domain-containing protein n=1 Tax=Phyllotreta striolata TaxID=444603 RepID=A0A9N9TEU9_PHYSR|nr:unnamed protein product [Phyllotreta striolata]